MRILTIAVLAFLPTILAAQCPSGSNSDEGVTLIRNDPFFGVSNHLQADNILQERGLKNRDGEVESSTSYYKFGFLILERVGVRETLRLDYHNSFLILENMKPGTRWTSAATLFEDDEVIGEAEAKVWIEGVETITISDCTYDVIRIRDSLIVDGGAPYNFSRLYSPELGMVVDALRMDENWNPVNSVSFDEIRVGGKF